MDNNILKQKCTEKKYWQVYTLESFCTNPVERNTFSTIAHHAHTICSNQRYLDEELIHIHQKWGRKDLTITKTFNKEFRRTLPENIKMEVIYAGTKWDHNLTSKILFQKSITRI